MWNANVAIKMHLHVFNTEYFSITFQGNTDAWLFVLISLFPIEVFWTVPKTDVDTSDQRLNNIVD